MEKKIIATTAAPGAIGPYSQAVCVGDLVYASGQLPLDPATGAFPEGIEAQTRQSLTNAKAIIEAAGLTMDNVVKTTVFLSDMNNFAAMNGGGQLSRPQRRGSSSPAQGRSGGDRSHRFQVSSLLIKTALRSEGAEQFFVVIHYRRSALSSAYQRFQVCL